MVQLRRDSRTISVPPDVPSSRHVRMVMDLSSGDVVPRVTWSQAAIPSKRQRLADTRHRGYLLYWRTAGASAQVTDLRAGRAAEDAIGRRQRADRRAKPRRRRVLAPMTTYVAPPVSSSPLATAM